MRRINLLRNVIVSAAMFVSHFISGAESADSLLVMFWNVENFFDYKDGGAGESDKDFSSFGSRRWTKRRFQAKCDGIAKSVLWLSDKYGRLPDVIGLAEVENRNVLYRLLNGSALKKTDYRIIHSDSRDRRGIDVALLYRESVLSPASITFRTPVHEGDTLNTRDILHVRMNMKDSIEYMDFIVNHHPSKFGGEKASEGRRMSVMQCMVDLCDSLASSSVISMGDFNDTPDSGSFLLIEGRMVNKGVSLHKNGRGTIRYEGKWELIDMFLVSRKMEGRTEMMIEDIPFLMTDDRAHPGVKPLRTYSGPKYIGGVSDHCPILLWIFEPIY